MNEELEIYKEEELGIKDYLPEELVKFVTDKYAIAERTIVKWYDKDSKTDITLTFYDANDIEIDSLKVSKIIYKNIIKPALPQARLKRRIQ